MGAVPCAPMDSLHLGPEATTGGHGVTVKLAAVTVDCEDALTVGRFWSAALGRPLDPNPSSDFAAIA